MIEIVATVAPLMVCSMKRKENNLTSINSIETLLSSAERAFLERVLST